MRLLSLFSGIGAPEKALDRLGIDYELVNFCEIDKYAAKSYCAIHGVDGGANLGDITKIDLDSLPADIDLITHGSPCQDFSVAGKQAGGEEGTNTRSSLMWNTVQIVSRVKPKVVLWENVKNVVSKRHKPTFNKYLTSLEELGYNNYYKILNAKDYGIPQNRERIFVVSIRQDVDNGLFEFPEPFELKLRIKDKLEETVAEKYYLSKDKIEKIQSSNFTQERRRIQRPDVCDALLARDYKDPKCVQVGQIYGTEKEPNPQAGRIYDPEGISPTVDSCGGGNRMPKVIERQPIIYDDYNSRIREDQETIGTLTTNCGSSAVRNGYKIIEPMATAMRGRYNANGKTEQQIELSQRTIANAITTIQKDSMVVVPAYTIIDDTQGFDGVRHYENYSPSLRASRSGLKTIDESARIRKLTPKECWRLMGFDDEDFEKASACVSNSQLYKQAGNSIVVNVLVEIFRNLYL